MLEKIIAVEVEFYDYFGGQKRDVEKFNNLLEAWNYYKKSSSLDFNYGDAYQSTREPLIYWTSEIKKTGRHPYKPKKVVVNNSRFSNEEINYLINLAINDDDIII